MARVHNMCDGFRVKPYARVRLGPEERALLAELGRATGKSETALVEDGLQLVYERELQAGRSVLNAAGEVVGRCRGSPRDLSTNRRHLDDFGR